MEIRASFKAAVQHAVGQLTGKVTLFRDTETGMMKIQVETPKQEASMIYVAESDEFLRAMKSLLIDGADTLAKLNAVIKQFDAAPKPSDQTLKDVLPAKETASASTKSQP